MKLFDLFYKKSQPSQLYNLRDRLFPLLRSRPEQNEINEKIENELITKPWFDDLEFKYAFDNDSYFSYLIKSNINELGDIENIHKLATDNLRRVINYEMKKTQIGSYGLLCGRVYEASLITLDEIWNKYTMEFNDDLIVSISNRDMIMFVPASNIELINNLKDSVNYLFDNCEYAITKKLFKYSQLERNWNIYLE